MTEQTAHVWSPLLLREDVTVSSVCRHVKSFIVCSVFRLFEGCRNRLSTG